MGKSSASLGRQLQHRNHQVHTKSSENILKMIKSISFLAMLVTTGVVTLFVSVTLAEPTTSELGNATNDSAHQLALNYLLFSSSAAAPSSGAGRGVAELRRLERLLKDTQHDHMSGAVDLPLAQFAWAQMQRNARQFAKSQSDQARPLVNRLLDKVQVSGKCRRSLNEILDHLAQLDDWAVNMFNSFGNFPPVGLSEGTLTSMGSYHQCVNVAPNPHIGQPKYCTYKFQPIIPTRPRYHNILASIENLTNFTTNNNDMFNGLAKKAQYFYYIKLSLATCMPSYCDENDLRLIGEQIALNTYIQYHGVKCLEKEQGISLDSAQWLAVGILLSLASISLLGTLVHLLELRSKFGPSGAQRDGHFKSTNVTLQRQNLLAASHCEQKTSILPAPVIQSSKISISDPSISYNPRAIAAIDFLLHFSLAKNARKLFDTSTSRRDCRKSLIPSSSSSATSSNQSDTNSDDVPTQANDISCVHGLRFWTISWIILGHTMQYTEWAAFGRAYQIEGHITSFWLHPVLNATFSVDTFFLISGLLTTYVTWTITRGEYWRFNKFAFLISRYLRLLPQVLIVMLIFIIFPIMGDGPYWRGLVQKESDHCKQNWWISALFLQAFYKSDQICNLVTWWLSIEMFYHFVSIFVILALMMSGRKGIACAITIGSGLTAYSCYLHYSNHYPPNMLPTLVQRYEVWDSIVRKFFWTPYPHSASYFVGLLLGYALYNRNVQKLSPKQVRWGWWAFAASYILVLFGTYHWNNNAPYSRIASTVSYHVSQILWSLATGWAILACALGHGGWLNSFLSSPVFVPLGRATYMTYLSHMLIIMAYPARMNLLMEPSYIVFSYIFIANLFLAYGLGITLTLVYESPILHLQKLMVRNMAQKFNDDPTMNRKIDGHIIETSVDSSLYSRPQDDQEADAH